MKRRGYCRWSAGLCVLLLLLSCESKDRYAGVYKAEGDAVKQEIILELKANGEGVWRTGSKEVFSQIPVVWYVKHGELRVNTKEGGVIVGKMEKDTIRMTLPAVVPLTFRKTP